MADLKFLKHVFDDLPEASALFDAIKQGDSPLLADGFSLVHSAIFIAAAVQKTGRPALVITADDGDAARLSADIEAAGVKINWDVQTAGADVAETEGTPLPNRVIESIKRNKIALKAPVTTPIGKGFRSVNVALRKELDFDNLKYEYFEKENVLKISDDSYDIYIKNDF